MTEQLLPGETLILKDHQHWIVLVKSLVIPVLLLVVVAIADFTVLYTSHIPHLRLILTLGVVALAGIRLIVLWIRWRSTSYTLTDQRIKIESGVFGRQSKMIPIDRVQDCSTKQSLFGRMLGYGRVEVDAAGAQGAEVLDHLPSPGTFRDQVFVQSERRRGGAPAAPANPSGV
ncbi:PH domain-containing protein [bacterium]|nr:MAG: PH domain-containing protein [bacterium]